MPSLASAVNFRDLGGLPAADGVVREGLVFRSASPQFLDPDDAATLAATVRLVLDLRYEQESLTEGYGHLSGPRFRNLPVVGAGGAEVEMEVLAGDLDEPGGPEDADPGGPREHLSAHYISYLQVSAGAFVTAFRELAADDGLPALVHCAAGKDRTGVLVALLLAVLGVPDEVIAADYARTADNLADIVAHLRTEPSYKDTIGVRPLDDPFAQSPPAAMRRVLAWLRREHGGADGALLAAGLEPDVLDTLRHRLVVA